MYSIIVRKKTTDKMKIKLTLWTTAGQKPMFFVKMKKITYFMCRLT